MKSVVWKRKFRSSAASFFACWLLVSCSYQIPKDKFALIQNLPSDPENLNPLVSNSAYAGAVFSFIYEQLFELDNETTLPKPRLAKRWEISEDKLQYTFYLRDDVHWQDGKPFTAEDVLFTYEKIMDPKVDAAPIRNSFRDVLKAEKIDTHTIRFTYRQPYIGALYTLGLMMVIPKHIFEKGADFNSHKANRHPLGTGPYRFSEWKTGGRIVLDRYDGYWGQPYPFRQLIFRMIPNEIVTLQLFKKGEIDLVDLNALQWARQTSGKKFSKAFVKHRLFTRYGNYNYVGWNLKKPLFQDKKVRLALAHLVDRGMMNEKLLFDLYLPITGPYYPFGKHYDKSLKLIEFNVGRAKSLLEEAGWKDRDGDGILDKNGVPFRFTLIFSGGVQLYEQFLPVWQEDLRGVGIQMELRRLEGVTLFRMINERDFDAYLAAWGRGANDEDLYQIWHSSQAAGGSNHISYSNPRVDFLLEEGRKEFDNEKRSAMNREIHRILYDEQPYLFLFARPDLIARDGRFKNVKEYPLGLDMREWFVE